MPRRTLAQNFTFITGGAQNLLAAQFETIANPAPVGGMDLARAAMGQMSNSEIASYLTDNAPKGSSEYKSTMRQLQRIRAHIEGRALKEPRGLGKKYEEKLAQNPRLKDALRKRLAPKGGVRVRGQVSLYYNGDQGTRRIDLTLTPDQLAKIGERVDAGENIGRAILIMVTGSYMEGNSPFPDAYGSGEKFGFGQGTRLSFFSAAQE